MEGDTREAALWAVGFLLDELLERLKKDVKNGYAICKAQPGRKGDAHVN